MDARNENENNMSAGDIQDAIEVSDGWEQIQKKDPVVELTSEMMGLLGHINDFVHNLELEECEEKSSDNRAKMEKEFNPEMQEDKDLDTCSSIEIVEKEDGLPDVVGDQNKSDENIKSRPLIPAGIIIGLGGESDGTLEQLQAHINDTVKLRALNQEVAVVLERLMLCMNKRKNKLRAELSGDVPIKMTSSKSDCKEEEDTDLTYQTDEKVYDKNETEATDKCEIEIEETEVCDTATEETDKYEVEFLEEDKYETVIDNPKTNECVTETEGAEKYEIEINETEKNESENEVENTTETKNSETETGETKKSDIETEEAMKIATETDEREKFDPEKSEHEECSSEITTDDDYSSQASSTVEEEKLPVLNYVVKLRDHLKHVTIPKYFHIGSEGPIHTPTHTIQCIVCDLEAEGLGQSKRAARQDAALHMIRLIIRSQNDGILPDNIPRFSNQQLQDMTPLLDSEMENYVNHLQHQCYKLQLAMPVYKILEEDMSSKEKAYKIQCCVSNFVTEGTGQSKKIARKIAAKNMLQQIGNDS